MDRFTCIPTTVSLCVYHYRVSLGQGLGWGGPAPTGAPAVGGGGMFDQQPVSLQPTATSSGWGATVPNTGEW